MLKQFVLTLGLLAATLLGALAQSPVYVRPYVRGNGTFVQGHYRSAPDSTPLNNWSTYPNVNPFTGSVGTRRYDTPALGFGASPSRGYTAPSYTTPNYFNVGRAVTMPRLDFASPYSGLFDN